MRCHRCFTKNDDEAEELISCGTQGCPKSPRPEPGNVLGVSSRTYLSSLERELKTPTLSKVTESSKVMGVPPLTPLTLAYESDGQCQPHNFVTVARRVDYDYGEYRGERGEMVQPPKLSSLQVNSVLNSSPAPAAVPLHLSSLSKCAHSFTSSDGCPIEVWELSISPTADFLGTWASRFRQHYCSDAEIDMLREGTGLSRADYLVQLAFPDKSIAPGPGIRAGDFAELLVSDYVEYVLGYWVPRGKYADKSSRDESVKGVDILGFRFAHPPSSSSADTLMAFEVKAQASGGKYTGRLQTAIDDSSKDYLRRAMTLNATKRRLHRAGQQNEVLLVQRFQNQSDHPYVYRSGAAAVLSDNAYDESLLQSSTMVAGHQNAGNLELIVIRGKELMQLIHALYERAANEA